MCTYKYTEKKKMFFLSVVSLVSLICVPVAYRFNDISASIRIKCVQYSMHFLLNHPELRQDIVDTLKLRQHDADENVRYEVVTAIVTTARRDFDIVSSSEDLLTFVKERTLDKKVSKAWKKLLNAECFFYSFFFIRSKLV